MITGKLPPIERSIMGFGLTGDSAYKWALFLKNESEMEDDPFEFSKWAAIEESLRPRPNKPVPASVSYGALEDAIKRYVK